MVGCNGFNSVGTDPTPLPIEVEAPCNHPLAIVIAVKGSSVGSDEIRIGRLGDALIECGKEKEIAVDAYNGVAGIIKDKAE